jgi:hypothetical protein
LDELHLGTEDATHLETGVETEKREEQMGMPAKSQHESLKPLISLNAYSTGNQTHHLWRALLALWRRVRSVEDLQKGVGSDRLG